MRPTGSTKKLEELCLMRDIMEELAARRPCGSGGSGDSGDPVPLGEMKGKGAPG